MNLLILTGKNCKKCPDLLKAIEALNYPFQEIDSETLVGKVMVNVLKIRSLPGIVIHDKGDVKTTFIGVPPTVRDLKVVLRGVK